jgi:hypothetical protein
MGLSRLYLLLLQVKLLGFPFDMTLKIAFGCIVRSVVCCYVLFTNTTFLVALGRGSFFFSGVQDSQLCHQQVRFGENFRKILNSVSEKVLGHISPNQDQNFHPVRQTKSFGTSNNFLSKFLILYIL